MLPCSCCACTANHPNSVRASWRAPGWLLATHHRGRRQLGPAQVVEANLADPIDQQWRPDLEPFAAHAQLTIDDARRVTVSGADLQVNVIALNILAEVLTKRTRRQRGLGSARPTVGGSP
jgi:hypothetical protein